MNAWPSFAAALYHGLHVVTAARVRSIDEGGMAALAGNRPVIIVANHQSHADTPVIAMNVPRERRTRLRFLASAARFGGPARARGIRDRAERWFLHGMAVHAYGAILVGDEHIGLGAVMVIFPEGTRSRDGSLGSLRPGAAIAALESGAPLVPMRLDGTGDALPKSVRRVRWRPTVTVRVRAPIVPAPGESPEALTARIAIALRPDGGAR
ncbi:MAG: 1-acyl-sn-glycerol-3-phosphate acyltransferase [Proteobacteria bacterium]|nr:1-acyl-sn-glycerol-3-phosphate acyltransferase [Pseudomonadota bacterium]